MVKTLSLFFSAAYQFRRLYYGFSRRYLNSGQRHQREIPRKLRAILWLLTISIIPAARGAIICCDVGL